MLAFPRADCCVTWLFIYGFQAPNTETDEGLRIGAGKNIQHITQQDRLRVLAKRGFKPTGILDVGVSFTQVVQTSFVSIKLNTKMSR